MQTMQLYIIFFAIHVCLIHFQQISYFVDAKENSCEKLSNCLEDLSTYVKKCGEKLKDFAEIFPKNATTEKCTQLGDTFLIYANFQSFRAREISRCVRNAAENDSDPKKCPKMDAPKGLRKRAAEISDSNKWLNTAQTIKKDCSNSDTVVDQVMTQFTNGQLLTRQQILDFVKKQCDGKSTLTVDDMPVIGGDAKIERSINKVLKECSNGSNLVLDVKSKADKKQFLTRNDIVQYIREHCQGNSTLSEDDLPSFYDSKLEKGILKVQNDCSNSKIILSDLSAKYHNKTIFSRKQVVDYVAKKCHGKSSLTVDDIPAFYYENSTNFGRQLEKSILKVQKECENSDEILFEVRRQHEDGRLKTSQDITKYVNANCKGKSTLTVDDLPFGDCSNEIVKNKTAECLTLVNGCNKAKYCNECYEISSLHNAVHRTEMELVDLNNKCSTKKKFLDNIQT